MTPKVDQEGLPEAPASVTYDITDKNGFSALFTVRGKSGADLLEVMNKVISPLLIKEGFTPHVRYSGAGFPKKEKDWVEGKKCPKCGARLYRQKYTDKKDGKEKTLLKCENNKWNPMLKKNVGSCDYVEWPDSSTAPAKEQSIDQAFPDKDVPPPTEDEGQPPF